MKGGEGEMQTERPFFGLLTGIIGGGDSEVFGGEKFPLTGLDKTLYILSPTDRRAIKLSRDSEEPVEGFTTPDEA
jgi:hypothetical protein